MSLPTSHTHSSFEAVAAATPKPQHTLSRAASASGTAAAPVTAHHALLPPGHLVPTCCHLALPPLASRAVDCCMTCMQ